MRLGSSAIAVGCAVWAYAAQAAITIDPTDGITGAEVHEMILSEMETMGVTAELRVSEYRHYPACQTQPRLRPKDANWSQVTMLCDDATPSWQRTVRTNASAITSIHKGSAPSDTQNIVILVENLTRGTIIEDHHITIDKAPSGTMVQFFTNPSDVIGRRMAQHLGQGRVLMARHLEIPWTVEKNTPVSIAFVEGGFIVETKGRALEDGQMGDLIYLENERSGRRIQGIVAGPHKIVVRPKIN